MATLPLNTPKFRAFDANGDPLAGGKLYSYAAGTSTPLDTFTTRAGTIANTNPVILDANGEADVWTTPGLLYKFVLADSADVIQWTEDNVPSGADTEGTTADAASSAGPGGRLSVSSGNPAVEIDVLSATTVYYVNYIHNKVPLYDGTSWALHAFSSELSQGLGDSTKSPAAAAANSIYDMFVWDDAGTLRLSRGPLWPSGTTRGVGAGTSEHARIDGRRVNKYAISNGPGAQRGLYVGTIYVGAAGVSDAMAFRHVWNAYNRLRRHMSVVDSLSTWNYTSLTNRQANGNAANQLDFVIGLNEEPVWAEVRATAANTVGASFNVGIGTNGTALTGLAIRTPGYSGGALQYEISTCVLNKLMGIGRNYLVWTEQSDATGVTTWYSNGASIPTSGFFGHLMA